MVNNSWTTPVYKKQYVTSSHRLQCVIVLAKSYFRIHEGETQRNGERERREMERNRKRKRERGERERIKGGRERKEGLTFDVEVGICRHGGALCVPCPATVGSPIGEPHLWNYEDWTALHWSRLIILEQGDGGLGIATDTAGKVHRLEERGKDGGWSSQDDWS